ncbi:hypothetical protein BV20DRAFT_417035 [Pilatotrama ljubarskyi]|nr:hypothetical protein BV20DRAFT_417035 [Pilatotrama ljubarskyi]
MLQPPGATRLVDRFHNKLVCHLNMIFPRRVLYPPLDLLHRLRNVTIPEGQSLYPMPRCIPTSTNSGHPSCLPMGLPALRRQSPLLPFDQNGNTCI